jgi:hypothetical protein
MISTRYGGLGLIMKELIEPQVFIFNFFSYKELLLGVKLDKVLSITGVTEVAMIHHIVVFGIIGVLLFLSFVGYNLLKSYQIINNLDEVERRFYFASLLIVILFLLSNIHYQVMFQVGVMEVFAIHMSYIVSLAFRSHKTATNH